jgi:hypothetical protein
MPPLIEIGSFSGVTSIAAAPLRKTLSAPIVSPPNHPTTLRAIRPVQNRECIAEIPKAGRLEAIPKLRAAGFIPAEISDLKFQV